MRHLVLSLLLAMASAVSLATAASVKKYEFVEEWNLWKSDHGKTYETEEEELRRHVVWLSNKEYIEEHNVNAEVFGFTLQTNRFADMTSEEFVSANTCYKRGNFTGHLSHKEFKRSPYFSLPDSVDWRTNNAVTDVKDQGQCGACYAFSATGALEGAHALAHDKLVPLSEQNIVDCSVPYGNHGCDGGDIYDAFQYVIDNQGVDTGSSYSYGGRQSQCKYDKNYIGATETGIVAIPKGSEPDLMAATATAGPIAIAIDGSSNAFRFYAGGIYDEPNCSTTNLTHSMLIIGYGTYKSKDYWLVKNSWGTKWGQSGYIMMARNKSNQCGIASAASFPTL